MNRTTLLVGLGFLAAGSIASAVPAYDTFGSLPGATFGGTGIPNDKVAITTVTDGANTIKIGLTAFQRYSNPPLTDSGAGVFTAGAGVNDGLNPGDPKPLGTTWGMGYYVEITGGGKLGDYDIRLLYDFDPGVGTAESDLGYWNFSATYPGNALLQDSQNLYFAFWNSTILPYIDDPTYPSFDANAAGEYNLVVSVKSKAGAELGRSAIDVNVVGVPDFGSTAALLVMGLSGVMIARRTRR